MAITTQARVLQLLGKSADATQAEQDLIDLLLPQVERAVKRFVGYSIEQVTHTHYLPRDSRAANVDPTIRYSDVQGGKVVGATVGAGAATKLIVPELPIRSISNLYEDQNAYAGQGSSDFASGTELTSGSDFFVHYDASGLCKSGIINRTASNWPARAGTVKVVYVAGYTSVELQSGIAADIELACLMAIKEVFSGRGDTQGPIKSERLGDYAVQYAIEGGRGLPRKSKKLLGPFVHMGKFL